MAKNTASSSSLLKLFHIIAAIQFGFSVYYNHVYVHIPKYLSKTEYDYGGKFKYLTFLNAIIQAFYYVIALFNDICGTNEVAPAKTPFIRKFKDYLYSALAFPIALNVGITFWTLYGIDRELVFPKALDAFFPNWLNHVMHTNIVIFIVLELFTSFRKYPNRRLGLGGLGFFMVSYLIWIHVVKHYSGVWVYPVLEVFNLPQRILFFVLCLIFPIGLYMFGEFANEQIWTREIKQFLKGRKVK